MDFNTRIFNQLLSDLKETSVKDQSSLNKALRLLAKWRHVLIQKTIVEKNGVQIMNGPFKGLQYLSGSLEGCYVPKLLGCYEQPLHSTILQVSEEDYDVIINIGSAEGYYAAGFAKLNPNTQVYAFDINTKAQGAITELLQKNKIANCKYVGEKFVHETFSKYKGKKCLVFLDIEGTEYDLLDPTRAPDLGQMAIIVESHDCFRPGTTDILVKRFAKTHKIEIISDNGDRALENSPKWFADLAHLDQLLAFWEFH